MIELAATVPAEPQGFRVADAQTGGLGETIPGFAITSPEGECESTEWGVSQVTQSFIVGGKRYLDALALFCQSKSQAS